MLLEAELHTAVAALEAANVPVIVLKGPALARTIYADRALRPYADLDLTVHKSDEKRAAAALVDHGYAEEPFEMESSQRSLVGHLHDAGTFHRMFAGANGRALIELHQDPLQLGLAPGPRGGTLDSRRTPTRRTRSADARPRGSGSSVERACA